MVSPITGFSSIAYSGQVRGINKAAPVTPERPEISGTPGIPAPSADNRPLQPGSALRLPSAALAVLQTASENRDLLAGRGGGDRGVAALITGSQSAENLLDSLFSGASGGSGSPFSDLLRQASTRSAPLQEAVSAALQQRADSRAQNSPAQSLLADFHAASNAYNKILLQNAQNVLAAGETTPLVA